MSTTIWKILLAVERRQKIFVPDGAEILCAREQGDDICIWFRCDPTKVKIDRIIYVVGTGHDCPRDARYLGTALLQGGALMLHVFEA